MCAPLVFLRGLGFQRLELSGALEGAEWRRRAVVAVEVTARLGKCAHRRWRGRSTGEPLALAGAGRFDPPHHDARLRPMNQRHERANQRHERAARAKPLCYAKVRACVATPRQWACEVWCYAERLYNWRRNNAARRTVTLQCLLQDYYNCTINEIG